MNHDETIELAPRWIRLIAFVIDMILLVFVIISMFYFFGLLDKISIAKTQEPITYEIVTYVSSLIAFSIINKKTLLENGQTLGKKFLNIKIVDLYNNIPTKNILIKRYAFYFLLNHIPIIGGGISLLNNFFIFGKEKRCIHDYISGTKVIKVNIIKNN